MRLDVGTELANLWQMPCVKTFYLVPRSRLSAKGEISMGYYRVSKTHLVIPPQNACFRGYAGIGLYVCPSMCPSLCPCAKY